MAGKLRPKHLSQENAVQGQSLVYDAVSGTYGPGYPVGNPAPGILAEVDLSGLTETTLDLDAIVPDGVRDVQIVLVGKVVEDVDGSVDEVLMQFNSDTGANYSWLQLAENSVTTSQSVSDTATSLQAGWVHNSDTTGNGDPLPDALSPLRITLTDFRGPGHKTFDSLWQSDHDDTTTAGIFNGRNTGTWRNTATVQTVRVFNNSGTAFQAGSTIRVSAVGSSIAVVQANYIEVDLGGKLTETVDLEALVPPGVADLEFVMHARTNRSSTSDNAAVQFNSDTGSNYANINQGFLGDGSALGAGGSAGYSNPSAACFPIIGANATAGRYGVCKLTLPNFRDTTTRKNLTGHGHSIRADGTTDQIVFTVGGGWDNTDAIDTVTFLSANSATFDAGSYVRIYFKGIESPSGGGFKRLSLSANQTSGLTVGQPIQFDQIEGFGEVTLDATTNVGRVTLPQGGRYLLRSGARMAGSGATANASYQWYDVTNATLIGNESVSFAMTSTVDNSSQLMATAYVDTVDGDVEVELRFTVATALTNITALLSFADIQRLDVTSAFVKDANALHTNIAGEVAALTNVTAAATDTLFVNDASDSDNPKQVTAQSIADLGGGGGTPNEESITSENITGTDTALADTLDNTPVANTINLYLNGVRQSRGAGKDFTISGSTITWLASSGTAVDMTTSDVLDVTYES